MAQRDDQSARSMWQGEYNAHNTASKYPVWLIPASSKVNKSQPSIGSQRQLENRKYSTRNDATIDDSLQSKQAGMGKESIGIRSTFMSRVDAQAKMIEIRALSNDVFQTLNASLDAVDAAKKKMEHFCDRYTSSPYIRANQRLAYLNKLMELEKIISEMFQRLRSMHFLRVKAQTWMEELRESPNNRLGDMVEEITSFTKRTEDFKKDAQAFKDEANNTCQAIEKILPRPSNNVLTNMLHLILRLWDGFFP